MRAQGKLLGSIALVTVVTIGCRQDSGNARIRNAVDDRTPTVSEIIDRMAETYANCKTYRDTGTVTTVLKSKRETEPRVTNFTTAMTRPDPQASSAGFLANKIQFRFSFVKNIEGDLIPGVIWRNGTDIKTWWEFAPEVESPDSLSLALAGLTGVSDGSAHTIPKLLLPTEVRGRMLTELKNAKRGDDKVFDNHNCFSIDAKYAGSPISIWIDQKTFLVRRIDQTTEFGGYKFGSLTTYNPVIDEHVPAELLKYIPPN